MTTTKLKIPKVLIVDDVPANLVAMEVCLAHLDVEIFRATSGHEALSLILKHDFALLLLDVQMPGMDGFETASLIRGNKETAELPIIFVTAISKDEQHVFNGYGLGAVDYLFKPLNPGILQAKVRVFVERYHHRCEREENQAALAEYAQALKRSNEDLEQFAYVASHDLQEPLRKVTSFCQLLQQSCGDKLDKDELSYIEHAVDGAIRMKGLISDLLAFSRVDSQLKDLAPTSAEKALNEAVGNLEVAIDEADARVTHDELPNVFADERLFSQLFQNLVGNAIKYRSPDRRPEIHVSATPTNDHWQFSVRDNGIGIGSNYFDRVFELFKRLHERNKYSGTGIGLAISKKIVERMGGKIWLESQEGVGTTFFFTLSGSIDDLEDSSKRLLCCVDD